ncbi:MAG: hypothetical protein HYR84_04260 [Planctomycetes bacterium]|nr:hypothetical protein [Planctomycetota bacterium]
MNRWKTQREEGRQVELQRLFPRAVEIVRDSRAFGHIDDCNKSVGATQATVALPLFALRASIH